MSSLSLKFVFFLKFCLTREAKFPNPKSSCSVLGNKKIKKPSRKSKSKKQKFDEDEDRKIVEPTSTQDVELEKLIQNLAKLHDQEKPSLIPELDAQDIKPTTSNLLDIVGKQLVAAIDWAKGLPGYETLTLNDQAILLQAGWIEMLLLNWTFYSLAHKNKTQFASNFVVCESLAIEFGLETVHNQLSSLISRVQGYGIDEEEFVCLKAIGLLNAGWCLVFKLHVFFIRNLTKGVVLKFLSFWPHFSS